MALTRTDRLNELRNVNTGSSINVSAGTAFTPSDNSLLVVVVGVISESGSLNSGTLTGGSLSWTLQATATDVDGTYRSRVEIWTAPVTTGASTTLNWTNAATNTDAGCRLTFQAFDYTNADGIVPEVGSATITATAQGTGAVNLTLSPAPLERSVVVAARYFADSSGADTTAAPGSGWTEIYDYPATSSGYGNLQSQERAGSTSTDVDWSDTAEAGGVVDGMSIYAAIEIYGAPGIAVTAGTLTLQGGYVELAKYSPPAPAFQFDAFQNDAFQLEAASGTYTLTVTGGTLQLQGASVNLLATRKLNVTGGTVTLQGASANLLATRRIAVTSGTVTLQGASVSLNANRLLTANAGTLTLGAGSTLLTASRLLTVTGGTVTLDGASVNLTYVANTPNIAVTAGTLTLDGASANLLATRKLDVTSGALTLSGSANLLAIRKLDVTASTLTLEGAATTLRAVRSLAVTSATLVLEGSSADLRVTRLLTVTPGALALDGGVVDLTYISGTVKQIQVDPGTLTLEGASVQLRHVIPYREPTGGAVRGGAGSGRWVKVDDDGVIRLRADDVRLPRFRVPVLAAWVRPRRVPLWITPVTLPRLTAPALRLSYDDTRELTRALTLADPAPPVAETWTRVEGEVRSAMTLTGKRLEQHLWRSSLGREEWWSFAQEWGINGRGQLILFHVWRSPSGRIERRAISGRVTA